MVNIAVVGSRDFNNYALLKQTLLSYLNDNCILDATIISGAARGADKLGEQFAKEFNLATKIFPADWDRFGKSAGYKRNIDIVSNSDVVFAFWDGKSRGTAHTIDLAKMNGITTQVIIGDNNGFR